MNAIKRIEWFFAHRIYASSDVIGYLVGSFIDEGKLIKETEYYAIIEYKNNIYRVWIENYPYAWLSKCESTSKEKYEFEYPDDKMIELSKRIKAIVDDKAHYTDWSTREDIKANLQFDLAVILDEYGYPPVTIDDVYKEVLEQAENFKKYAS